MNQKNQIESLVTQNHYVESESFSNSLLLHSKKRIEQLIIVETIHLVVVQCYDLKNTQRKTHRQQRKCVTGSHCSKSQQKVFRDEFILTHKQENQTHGVVIKCFYKQRHSTHLYSRRGTCQTEQTISSSTSSFQCCPAKSSSTAVNQTSRPITVQHRKPTLFQCKLIFLKNLCFVCCCSPEQKLSLFFLKRFIYLRHESYSYSSLVFYGLLC